MNRKITLIGNVNIDLIMGTSTCWPKPGTEVVLPYSEWRVGGATGNSGLALQALGSNFRMIANTGNDDFGKWLRQPFTAEAKTWTVSNAATGLSFGLTHPDGERTFFTSLGHLSHFALDDVLQQLPEQAEEGEIALLSGAFVAPKLFQRFAQLLAVLRDRGFSIALDTGWPSDGWSDEVRQHVLHWSSFCNHLLLNELETRSLLGMMRETAEDVALSALDLIAPNGTVVIKRGAKGALACQKNFILGHEAPPTNVVDTIGAGDVFNAGYLYALASGKSLSEAISFAVQTASTAISTMPRSYSIPAIAQPR